MLEATDSLVVVVIEEKVLQLEIGPLVNCVEIMVTLLHHVGIALMGTSCLKVELMLVLA